MIGNQIVYDVLVRKCKYKLSEIMVLGFGQGGMVGLLLARELGLGLFRNSDDSDSSYQNLNLSGVVSIGAPYPLASAASGTSTSTASTSRKNSSPVLLIYGRDSVVVSDSAIQRTKNVFEFVQLHQYARRGDTMPRNRDEVLPLMQFFARRLKSRLGVPEGSVEISS